MATTVGEHSPAPDQEKAVNAEPAVPYALTRKGRTWNGARLPANSRTASCPKCSKQVFSVVDVEPDGDYPSIRFLCLGCQTGWFETQLKGIEWVTPEDLNW